MESPVTLSSPSYEGMSPVNKLSVCSIAAPVKICTLIIISNWFKFLSDYYYSLEVVIIDQ